jgi:hypothetical protein
VDRFAGRTVTDPADGHALIQARQDNHPVVGEPAPDFALDLLGGGAVRLSAFAGKRPVVLIFGSIT